MQRGNDLNILIVEDEAIARKALASLLTVSGYQTAVAGSGEAALARIRAGCDPEVALVDVDLPGMSGLEFIRQMLADRPGVHPVLITAEAKDALDKTLISSIPYLRKPLDFDELLVLLQDRESGTHEAASA